MIPSHRTVKSLQCSLSSVWNIVCVVALQKRMKDECCHLLGHSAVQSVCEHIVRFGGTYHFRLQGRGSAEQDTSVQQVPWKEVEVIVPPKRLFTYKLHTTASQMTPSITRAVRISDPTEYSSSLHYISRRYSFSYLRQCSPNLPLLSASA
jgi:hypothetical protein